MSAILNEHHRVQAGATLPSPRQSVEPLISVEELSVEFNTSRGRVRVVDRASWAARPGEILAIVGESGSGKSVSALAVMGLLARPAGRVVGGRVMFDGRDLIGLPPGEMRALRGREIGMVFQEPMSSLNPILTIGVQIMEPLMLHLGLKAPQARARAAELLALVGISEAERRLDQYPHNFSGGMRQRVGLARAICLKPQIMLYDEPTTGLDPIMGDSINDLIVELHNKL